jgi:hypothetical protein
MNQKFDILYCHATARNTRTLGHGHWFFHTGQLAICAAACEDDDGRWSVKVYWERAGKESPEGRPFGSIDEVISFVSDYFDDPVVKVRPRDFPKPDDL